MFDTKYPLIQAPMAGVQGSDLVIAVCETGGIGSLPCAMLDATKLRSELEAIEAATDKPYNVNFFAHKTPSTDEAREQKWRGALSTYYDEFDIDVASIADAPSRAPFSSEMADVLSDFKPAFVSFHFGLPSSELMDRVRQMGAKIISSATTVEEAIWLEQQGVDAIIAQGLEAGGHRGHFLSHDLTKQMGTQALLPQIVQAVNVPVIAAGGVGSPKAVKALLDQGATAVQVGTSYMLCDEATTTPLHRDALKSEAAGHTALTNIFSGRPARGIVNRIMREEGPITENTPNFPLAGGALVPLKSAAEKQGLTDFTSLWSGQDNSGCKEISAREMTLWLVSALEG